MMFVFTVMVKLVKPCTSESYNLIQDPSFSEMKSSNEMAVCVALVAYFQVMWT